ncbi:MAG: type IV secretory system conjugative DNA transfer family protein, partial [Paracoccaceae bacterium]
PLSMRAMPMTPPPDGPRSSEADVERAGEAAGAQSSGQTDVATKKTAPVIQAVVAEEQRQMEMDFVRQAPEIDQARVPDDKRIRSALGGLGKLEKELNLRTREGFQDR